MKSLIYDTETTGLPDWGKPSEDPCQPRVTHTCAELVDDDTREVYATLNFLIKPDGWTIPPDLEQMTGITTAKAAARGVAARIRAAPAIPYDPPRPDHFLVEDNRDQSGGDDDQAETDE